MKPNSLYVYMQKQMPVMILLSIFPGMGYILLGWINGIYIGALVWYLFILALSAWGYRLYKSFDLTTMSEAGISVWYRHNSLFFYLFFFLWSVIFLLYATETASGMHYIAVFTQIGASTVAATILFPDKKLFKPVIISMILLLTIYFLLIATWYGYVLSIFSGVFGWVLLYAASSSNRLFYQTTRQATHDYLTGLYNRQYLIDALQIKMNGLRERSEYSFLLLIDLDHFKSVNDSLGHDFGDELLREVVRRIQQTISQDCMLARLGGDEFIIIGGQYSDRSLCQEQALKLSEEILARLKATYLVQNHQLYISASIGVSQIDSEGSSSVDFIKEADIAMYEVKSMGRDGVFVFNESMSKRVEESLQLEQLLHFAVDRDEIELAYQSQVDGDKNIVGVEVLARWESEEIGTVVPDVFILAAEKTGLIIELGRKIIRKAFITLSDWEKRNIHIDKLSINISMRQFTHAGFVSDVKQLCQEYLSPNLLGKIVFEITEGVAAGDLNKVIHTIEELKALGIHFSMDDFGTGYSSLSYVQKLPVDEIKIDRVFISDLTQHSGAEEMVDTILNMARIFDLSIVAEGVETKAQWDFLKDHGCKIFQGYLFSKPLNKVDFEAYYLSNQTQESIGKSTR